MRKALLSAGIDAQPIVVQDIKRQGFSKTVNLGWKQAVGDVMILNDDIDWFQYGWLRILSEALHSDDTWGVVGPSGKSSTTPINLTISA